ncbi:MAG: MoaD/ThiS family protein [Actinobacteria bacterium]|nr:MoaD/ThiS family protein [Actinomycetota bacterium]
MSAIVRFWAGARRAAGCAQENTEADSLSQLRAELAERPALAPVIGVASFLIDGTAASGDAPIPPGSVVDVLPPFAGGAS